MSLVLIANVYLVIVPQATRSPALPLGSVAMSWSRFTLVTP